VTALRLAVCLDETGAGHCVLTVDAIHNGQLGTWVLDNRFAAIMSQDLLTAKGYTWIMREVPGERRWRAVA
jgi:predicted transglutaminase-like cysteine proteinase